MDQPSGFQSDGFGRVATLVLVGVLLFSSVAGVIGGGIAAAQQGGSGETTGTTTPPATPNTNQSDNDTGRGGGETGGDAVPSQPINATTAKFEENGFEYSKLKQWRKEKVEKNLRTLWKNNLSVRVERGKTKAIIRVFDAGRGAVGDDVNSSEERMIRQIIANVFNKEIAGVEPKTKGGPSEGNGTKKNTSVASFITKIKQQQFRYKSLSDRRKDEVKTNYRELANKNLSDTVENTKIRNIIQTLEYGAGGSLSSQEEQEIRRIISTALGESGRAPDKGPDIGIDIKLPELIVGKLQALADELRKGAASILTDLYNLAFSTPVPENSGWKGVLGTPVDTKANQTFHALYQELLVEKLYPVTYSLLSLAIIFMAISMAGNPFMSHHEVMNYLIKLVLAIMYWAFAWIGVTLMHGVVNEITLWIRPSPEVMGELVTNIEALSAGAVGAYLFGSGGIMATLFTLGVELGMRRVLLVYVFPYIFPALLLVLYLSPWQRLRGYASMAIWQYVNVLTMTIPIALLLKAAAVVSLEIQGKPDVVAMLILVALFGVAAAIPVVSTYFHIQMPGTGKKVAKRGASGAYGRLGDAKDKIGWGGDESASDSSASGGSSPGDNTDEAVAASLDSRPGSSGSESRSSTSTDTSTSTSASQETSAESSGLASSGTVDSTPDTTAGWVRELHDQENRDPMSDDAVIEAFVDDQSRRTTTSYNPGD